jgi:hypothetical protein
MTPPTLKLQAGAEELLQDFAMTEPDFEAQASAITAKLGSKPGEGALSDDDLFRAPALPAESGEPSLPVPPSAVRAARDVRDVRKSSFTEMARKSLKKGEDDSTALAKELMAATAQSRRPDAALVERVKAAGRAAATATPLPTNEAERTSGVVTRVEAAVAAPAAPASVAAPAPASPGLNRGTVIGIFGTVVALAACFALYVKSSEPKASPTSVALQAERDSKAPVAVAKPETAAVGAVEATKPSEAVLSPEALAASEPPAAVASEKPSVAKAGAAPVPAMAGAKPVAAPSSAPKQELVELAEDPTPQQAPVAQKKSESEPEPQLKPAEGSSGSVPLSPSAGAVSTALGSVRSGASACLAGQTESVSASVTFASDGHVLSVRASGPAAACIQAALSKAHVAPFAKESFTASTTVRPP